VTTLSEADSKRLLAGYGVPVLDERSAPDADAAATAADAVGYPVVVKLCGDTIAHKTERGLVRLRLDDARAVRAAAADLLARATVDDGAVELLVAPMVSGTRELIVGLVRDPQFGPCVMLGVGGVLTEALGDVAFRRVPLSDVDADELIDDLVTRKLLGAWRGEPPVDRRALRATLVGLSKLAAERPDVTAVDINPLIVVDGEPIAVDALVEIGPTVEPAGRERRVGTVRDLRDGLSALFEPRGVIVAGASSHPGKFGFVALHNILAAGYPGKVGATNLDGTSVLGIETVALVDDLPEGPWDLVFVCTPAAANAELLRACARRGVRAAFLTSAGYGEAGESGRRAEHALVSLADELGIVLAGPNGQGVVSTPARLCAQIVAPNPPAGRIAIASQSGNFVSSFENWATQSGVGVSRAVSAGNAAAVGIADYLDWYTHDDATAVSIVYVEGVSDGQALYDSLVQATTTKPVVLVKGGTTAGGQRAAASHTGSLASDERVFAGLCRQAGVTVATTIEEAFEAAATFATQALPAGPRTAVVTTAGGWGVVTADAIARDGALQLAPLPDDLLAAIDEHLPPRWSRNNPIDLAGGETRDTIPTVLELVARHPAIDAIVYLGLGIQSNQARLAREGGFYPDYGLERIVTYHERQDARFARAAADIADATGKPILTATELAVATPDNPGPATVRATGRLCYLSANRAVTALGHLWRYARYRQNRGLD
jgi:acyl-CoA synthetase (NDP forming)